MTRTRQTSAFWFALASGLVLVGINAFQWTIIDIVSPFLIGTVKQAGFGLIAVAGFVALVQLMLGRTRWGARLLPLAICLVALAIASWTPWTKVAVTVDFWAKQGAREAVVADILAGRLTPNDNAAVTVPFGLSAGGDQAILETCEPQRCVLFFTFRGVIDNYAGFLYVPEGSELVDLYYSEKIPFGGNWFWVRAD